MQYFNNYEIKKVKLLIIDLDNTIFETKSIDPKIFNPAINLIEEYYQSKNENSLAQKIISELWTTPMDEVFDTHKTPGKIKQQFYNKLNVIDYNLDITTYPDYDILKKMPHKKILVTTGYKKLQLAKIKALKIENDFNDIVIDDPLSKNRKFKLGIFKEILEKEKLNPKEIWIIGDSIENEIKAGKQLGMNTVQRLKPGVEKSKFSDFGITSFSELNTIVN